MKKETVTGLKRQNKELEESNNRLYRENRRYEKDLEDYKQIKEQLDREKIKCAELRGNIAGICMILDKFSFDMSVVNKGLSEDEIYKNIDRKRHREW